MTYKCVSNGCNKTSTFAAPGERNPRTHCSVHAPLGYISKIRRAICIYRGCRARALYGDSIKRKVIFCRKHKPTEFRATEIAVCKQSGCNNPAGWRTKEDTKLIFCKAHKSDEHVTNKYRECQFFGCQNNATWGETINDRTHCSDHRDPELHVKKEEKGKLCEQNDCDTAASYGIKGTKIKIRCKLHKLDEDVNVATAKCRSCNLIAHWGHPGGKRMWCQMHKEDGAISLSHRSCISCATGAYYGFPGQGNMYCLQHRIAGTIARPNKLCVTDKCRKRAEFGVTKHEHCETHKDSSEINLVNRKCSSCGLMGALNRNEHCEDCRPELYEKKALYKQKTVTEFLKTQGLLPDSEDRMLENGECGRERPDIFFSNDDQPHTVITEIDEFQHKSYECSRVCICDGLSCNCDITRMKNIQQGIGGQPGYFIRFNTDEYKDAQKKNGKVSDIERLRTLEGWIRHLLITPPTEFLQVVYLFYDGYTKEETKIETLVAWEKEETYE